MEKLAFSGHKIDANPFLEMYSGHQCNICPQIFRTINGIYEHVRIEHGIVRRSPGRLSSSSQHIVRDWTAVACQQLFISGSRSTYLAVRLPSETRARRALE